MRKIILITIFTIFAAQFLSAQVTEKENDLKKVNTDTINGWKKGGMFAFTFGQSSFTNWASGGINNISVNGLAGLFANYKKDNLTWGNRLDLGYGLQILGTGDNKDTQKTDDKFDFSSKLGLKAADKLYYAALMNFKTQFTNGYAYPDDSVAISGFMAPGYLLFAAGIDYRPSKVLSVFIAPLTSKTTFVNNQELADAGAYGVDPGKNIRSEFGGYLKAVYAKDIMKNVNLNTKLGLFSNYLHNPQNIDVDWEVLIGMKINKYITANISTQLLYDDDIMVPLEGGGTGKRVQFKEILGIGFSVKF
ncbi:MAG: DUF3078 domain-containing protein [Bacteroidales bacterium]|nr:DUF3078 domain-containing protein [Bacteroidales bacterium]